MTAEFAVLVGLPCNYANDNCQYDYENEGKDKLFLPSLGLENKNVRKTQKNTTKSRPWKYHLFFDIISYHIIGQKNDIISFISYR
jgi:hypothetical protein